MIPGTIGNIQVLAFMVEGNCFASRVILIYLFSHLVPVAAIGKWRSAPVRNRKHKYIFRNALCKHDCLVQQLYKFLAVIFQAAATVLIIDTNKQCDERKCFVYIMLAYRSSKLMVVQPVVAMITGSATSKCCLRSSCTVWLGKLSWMGTCSPMV